MYIRAATATDEAELTAVALAAKASWGYSHAQIEAWRDDLSLKAESIRSQPTFIAEIEGEVVGFYQLIVRGRMADLEHLWVRPEVMRNGIGRALMSHAVKYAAGHGIDSLSIDSEPNAESFYASCGAIRVGLRPAPIDGQPGRIRPQMVLSTSRLDPSFDPGPRADS